MSRGDIQNEIWGDLKFQPVPPEHTANIERMCIHIFDKLDQVGNDKIAAECTIEVVLAHLQRTMFENLDAFKANDAAQINVDFIALTALIRVAFNNPMWETDALQLQLKEECRNILRGAEGVQIKR